MKVTNCQVKSLIKSVAIKISFFVGKLLGEECNIHALISHIVINCHINCVIVFSNKKTVFLF